MNIEGIYAQMQEWTNQFNHWSLNEGGAEVIAESATLACTSLALFCFIGLFFERRNTATQKLSNQQSGLYVLAMVFNWTLGTMGALTMIMSGKIFLGLVTLAMIYLIPTSRSLSCDLASTLLAKVPNLFYKYDSIEKYERKKKINIWLHRKAKCAYPEMC